jgi:hypothetical protein
VRSGGRNRGRNVKTREGGWIECVVSNDGMMVVSRASNVTRRRRGCARGRDGARSVTVSQPAREPRAPRLDPGRATDEQSAIARRAKARATPTRT